MPYLTLMWGAAFPPSYELSDVQRAPKGFYGPCPGFVDVRRLERVEIPGDLPVQRPIQGHLRSFLTVRSSGTYTAQLEGNEEAVLRIGGVVVATSRDGVPASASIELAEGTHPVAISFFTLRSQPNLDFRLTGGNGGERRWRFTTQAPADKRFHPRLVQTRFTR